MKEYGLLGDKSSAMYFGAIISQKIWLMGGDEIWDEAVRGLIMQGLLNCGGNFGFYSKSSGKLDDFKQESDIILQ